MCNYFSDHDRIFSYMRTRNISYLKKMSTVEWPTARSMPQVGGVGSGGVRQVRFCARRQLIVCRGRRWSCASATPADWSPSYSFLSDPLGAAVAVLQTRQRVVILGCDRCQKQWFSYEEISQLCSTIICSLSTYSVSFKQQWKLVKILPLYCYLEWTNEQVWLMLADMQQVAMPSVINQSIQISTEWSRVIRPTPNTCLRMSTSRDCYVV